MPEQMKQYKKTIGLKQTLKLLESNGAQKVIIAADADEKVVGRLRDACTLKGIPVEAAESMKILGKACGIDVGAAVVGVAKDEN